MSHHHSNRILKTINLFIMLVWLWYVNFAHKGEKYCLHLHRRSELRQEVVNSLISPLSRLCRLLIVNPSLEEVFIHVYLNFKLHAPESSLHKRTSGNAHKDWVYANSVYRLKSGNLIHSVKKPNHFWLQTAYRKIKCVRDHRKEFYTHIKSHPLGEIILISR